VLRNAINLSTSQPPRSGVEVQLKQALHNRRDKDTAISRIYRQIGIPGNERADRREEYESHLGVTAGSPHTATEEGIRLASKATKKQDRQVGVFGLRRGDWCRRALSPYALLRTDGGPQRSWLHRIGKTADPSCPCGHHTENGLHLAFECPRFRRVRTYMLGFP